MSSNMSKDRLPLQKRSSWHPVRAAGWGKKKLNKEINSQTFIHVNQSLTKSSKVNRRVDYLSIFQFYRAYSIWTWFFLYITTHKFFFLYITTHMIWMQDQYNAIGFKPVYKNWSCQDLYPNLCCEKWGLHNFKTEHVYEHEKTFGSKSKF